MALNVGKLYATLGLDKKEFDKGMGEVDKAGGRLSRAGSKLLDAGKKIAKVGAVAGAAGFTALGVAALKSGADIETTQKVLTGLYDDADAAADVMSKLRDVASTSPIDYASYTAAAESLAYAGVKGDEAVETLENMGLALAAAGGGAEEMDRATDAVLKMVNAGKVGLDSLQQLSNAGVPIISGLADHFGVSMEEINSMASKGKIGLEDVLDVMQHGTGETFQQMIKAGEEASQSFENQWKIAKDNLLTTLGEAMQPVMPMLTGALQDASDVIGPAVGKIAGGLAKAFTALIPAISPVIEVLADVFAVVAEHLGPVIEAVAPAIGRVAKAFGGALTDAVTVLAPHLPALAEAFGELVAVLAEAFLPILPTLLQAVTPLLGPITQLATVAATLIAAIPPEVLTAIVGAFLGFKTVATVLTTLRSVVLGLNAAMMANPAGAIALAVIGLGAAVYTAYQKFEPFRNVVDTVGRFFRDTLWPAIRDVAEIVGGALVDAWHAIQDPLSTAFEIIKTIGEGVITLLLEPITTMVDVVSALFRGDFSEAFDIILGIPGRLLDVFGDLPEKLLELIGEIPGLVLDALAGFAGLLLDLGKKAIRGLLRGITQTVPELATWWAGLPGRVVDWLVGLAPALLDMGVTMISKLWEGAGSLIGWLGEQIVAIPGQIVGWLGDLGSKIFDVGKQIPTKLRSGAESLFGKFSEWVVGLPGRIIAWLGNAATKLFQWGKDLIQGLWDGIFSMKDWLMDRAVDVAGWVTNPLGKVWELFSPSRVMMRMGGNLSEGLAIGMGDARRLVDDAAADLAAAAVPDIPDIDVHATAGRSGRHGVGVGDGPDHGGGSTITTGDIIVSDEPTAEALLRGLEFYVAQGRL